MRTSHLEFDGGHSWPTNGSNVYRASSNESSAACDESGPPGASRTSSRENGLFGVRNLRNGPRMFSSSTCDPFVEFARTEHRNRETHRDDFVTAVVVESITGEACSKLKLFLSEDANGRTIKANLREWPVPKFELWFDANGF